ncbi:hypothetical protein CFP65_5078 [Kitasatospora sp. MMS16-BH015]|uniref:hypothetical protein n=1 Tax=Kitasatospora sp. MMS16-BH015 TaxID=2018025 RepID=UPI000CA11A35|nr:hypothetical protein [Kitasatospora sp. MMS16-BH015]AUG79790.1 hypothetical protein CFP65_5078 [Kitasatospora sp. MMS16-BH015]
MIEYELIQQRNAELQRVARDYVLAREARSGARSFRETLRSRFARRASVAPAVTTARLGEC